MTLRHVVGVLSVFMAGMAVGGLTLYTLRPDFASLPEAQRRTLALLDKPPVLTPIGENKIAVAVRRITPAVVSIDTIGRATQQDENGKSFAVEQEVKGKGSGVILSPDGYIVTNDHVIDGASRIRVTFSDGQWRFARLIGRDRDRDLAVLRAEKQPLFYAALGDSDHLEVGETVIAVGNPMGLGSSVTSGIVSALNRHNLQIDAAHNLDGAIQTDAAINRGNSGGALANINGELIGINTAILSTGPGGGSIGLGFALPINMVRHIVRDLIAKGNSTPHRAGKSWLGIRVTAAPESVNQSLGLPLSSGAIIEHVLPETPASLAGLENDDIILRIDGTPVKNQRDVAASIIKHKAGELTILHILRPGEHAERDIRIVVQEHPESIPLTH